MYFTNIYQIKQLARDCGNHFFDPDSMRFFDSRILSRVYGGRYFVTSEQFHGTTGSEPRRYTVRIVTYENGRFDIDTVGEFQQHETAKQAQRVAERLGAAHALELATI
jgi:NADPH-dependent ferric siderophore reductase